MNNSIIYDKAFKFAVKIIALYKYLNKEKNEYVLAKQLLRCGTSIGANTREGIETKSKKDFAAKLSIALKEAGEPEYWIDLLEETGYLNKDYIKPIKDDLREIIRILNSILRTTKNNLNLAEN